jgi:hypothetical protein
MFMKRVKELAERGGVGNEKSGSPRRCHGLLATARAGLRFANVAAASRAMDSHEVMREVLKKTSAKQIAADLQLSLSLIYKWAEPPEDDSGGANNPLDRVGQLIRSTRDTRIAQWVCEQVNGFYIRNPQNLPASQPLIPITNDIVQEFADMLATIAVSSSDSVITKDEAKKIRARWEELKSVTEGFVKAAEGGNFGPPKEPAEKKV